MEWWEWCVRRERSSIAHWNLCFKIMIIHSLFRNLISLIRASINNITSMLRHNILSAFSPSLNKDENTQNSTQIQVLNYIAWMWCKNDCLQMIYSYILPRRYSSITWEASIMIGGLRLMMESIIHWVKYIRR